MLEVLFEFRAHNCWAQRVSERYPNIRMNVFSIQGPKGLSRWEGSFDDLLQSIEEFKNDPTLTKVRILEQDQKNSMIIVESICNCTNRPSSILAKHDAYYLLPNQISTQAGRRNYHILVATRETFDELCSKLEQIGDIKIISLQTKKDISHPSYLLKMNDIKLTPAQRKALGVAFSYGYYKIPKQIDIRTLSKKLNISPSTFHEALKKAEQKIVAAIAEYLEV
ncbi:MAG: helix-turn-helix domain-containing protein [Candidatus Hermodarchaeota archaeon]